MNYNKQIIILSNIYTTNNEQIYILNESVELIDDVTIKCQNDDIYTFDYLIFTNPNQITNFRETNILHEAGLPVTNYFHQTTYENIYFIDDNSIDTALTNIYEDD